MGGRRSGRQRRSPRCFLNAVGFDTLRAHPDPARLAVYQDPHPLQVGVPAPRRLVVGVAHIVTEAGSFAADFANSGHVPPFTIEDNAVEKLVTLSRAHKGERQPCRPR